ncbi:MAG: hypothetical protein ACM31O_21030 [Bacteroidota bacterium]
MRDPKTRQEWNDWFFDDPVGCVAEINRRSIQQLKHEYQQHHNQERFWQTFYERHDDLKAEQAVLQRVFQAKVNDLSNVPVDEAIDQIADIARKEIDAENRRRGRAKEYSVYRGGPGISGNVPVPPEGTGSLSAAIKAKKERRRVAQGNFRPMRFAE